MLTPGTKEHKACTVSALGEGIMIPIRMNPLLVVSKDKQMGSFLGSSGSACCGSEKRKGKKGRISLPL